MPASITAAPSFLLDTDYPLDKAIFLGSGSFTMGASTTGSEFVNHGLPFIPLIAGYWSLTSDFSLNYEFGNGVFPSGNPGYLFQREIGYVQATITQVKMDWVNISTATTAYYRLYAFEPSNLTTDIASVSATSDGFVLNTDYNYLKLLSADTASPGTATTYTVTHGLGYKPQVLAWFEYAAVPGFVAPVTTESTVALEVNDTAIVFQNPFADNVSAVHWRIYLDG